MKRALLALFALSTLPLTAQTVTPDCSVWNHTFINVPQGTDYTEHTENADGSYNGYHRETTDNTANCIYSGTQNATSCTIKCSDSISTTPVETNTGYISGVEHMIDDTKWGGIADSTGPQISCGGEADVAVISCPSGTNCILTATQIGVSGTGLSGSVNFTPNTTIWQTKYPFSATCGVEAGPGCVALGMPTYNPDGGAAGLWEWLGKPYCY